MTRIFLISDNHFSNYDGIIHDLKRSSTFDSAEKMNAVMIEKWNKVVQSDDIVFNLGDFAWLRDEMVHYANKLNGKKCFILGNHDFEGNRWWLNEKNFDNAVFPLMDVLTYKNRDFLLIHRPEDVPHWWQGWVIHGHHHWMLPKYPFIDGKRRNINVSCEIVNYTPVDLDWILYLGIDNIERMDTVNSEPIKW